ncbi:hypothetical protein [Pseudomonas brassicacearum]|nr:hypothetical protein [Pseudomonas brassicacearum]
MTNDKTVTMSRELAERIISAFSETGKIDPDYVYVGQIAKELNSILAAPVVERQPVAWGTMQPEFSDDDRTLITDKEYAEVYDRQCYTLTPLFDSSPAPVAVTDGWKLVPIVATLEMKNAGWQECERQGVDPESIEMQTIWTAMHLSAPACLDKVKEMNS